MQTASISPALAAPSSPPPASAAYAQGVADWDALQAWFNAQSGDRRAGADYWAANRNVLNHGSCAAAAGNYSGNEMLFEAGCQDAKGKLDLIDQRRADQDYRTGFSDKAKGLPLSSEPATPQARADGGSDRYATVSTINLNLRSGAGASYDPVTVMPQGTKVRIVRDADNGWEELEVRSADGQVFHGFANGQFLTPAP